MMNRLSLFLVPCLFASLSAAADDCGEPPLDLPTIPNGTTATVDDIRVAREDVVKYSQKVDAYLSCMDKRSQALLPYMTKEEKARWDEDLTNLHNGRRDVQIKMNDAIRAYRDAHKEG